MEETKESTPNIPDQFRRRPEIQIVASEGCDGGKACRANEIEAVEMANARAVRDEIGRLPQCEISKFSRNFSPL